MGRGGGYVAGEEGNEGAGTSFGTALISLPFSCSLLPLPFMSFFFGGHGEGGRRSEGPNLTVGSRESSRKCPVGEGTGVNFI